MRTQDALTSVALAGLGFVLLRVLVANSGDNAYLGLFLVGGALILAGVPFAVLAMLPSSGLRRVVGALALGLFVFVGVVGVLVLLASVLVIQGQDYTYDPRVPRNHLIGLAGLIVTYGLIVALRRRSSGARRGNRSGAGKTEAPQR